MIDPMLRRVPVYLSVTGVLATILSWVIFGAYAVVAGIVLGFVLVIANFVFLVKIVAKLLDEHYKAKPALGLFFMLKMAFIALLVWVAFWVIEVHVLAFVFGYLCLVPVILVVQFLCKPS